MSFLRCKLQILRFTSGMFLNSRRDKTFTCIKVQHISQKNCLGGGTLVAYWENHIRLRLSPAGAAV